MTKEDGFTRVPSEEPTSADEASASKKRRKRRWDQPDESVVSCKVAMSGVLSMSNVGCPGVSLAEAVSAPGNLLPNLLQVGYVGISKGIQTPILQQQAAALIQKLNQPKIQEDLIIAREIVINDADPAIRHKLTKRQTQEEIQKCTGAVVITRGKYRPPTGVPDGEKPLYLHISAGANIKETAERILAVERAAAMVEEMLKQVSQPLSTCVYLGFDADPSLNIATRIRGPNDQYINHIMNETGVTVLLRGSGSGYSCVTQGEGGPQPLHLFLSSNSPKSLEAARLLAENLLDTISRECGATRVSSCKVYGAVPPPQQLLVGVQGPGIETRPNTSSSASLACSAATAVPVVTTAFPYGQVAQPGGLLPSGHSQRNGIPCSQPLQTACTSYSGYAGIYPQATPLQQVVQALRQSAPVTSAVTPPTTSGSSLVPKSSTETEKRPLHKRKFQESPAALMRIAISQQESGIQEPCKYSSSLEGKKGTAVPSLKLDSLSSKTAVAPSLKSLLPPPPPRNTSSMPPPALESIPLPPPLPPKFTSSASIRIGCDEDNTPNNKSDSMIVPAVSDTLVKLMEYGEDDDDAEENGHETSKSPSGTANCV